MMCGLPFAGRGTSSQAILATTYTCRQQCGYDLCIAEEIFGQIQYLRLVNYGLEVADPDVGRILILVVIARSSGMGIYQRITKDSTVKCLE